MIQRAINRQPFIRYLLPLIIGIAIGSHYKTDLFWQGCVIASLPFFASTLFTSQTYRYLLRPWVGVGFWLLFMALGGIAVKIKDESTSVALPAQEQSYLCDVIETGVTSNGQPRLLVRLPSPNTSLYLYLSSSHSASDSAARPRPGDWIRFTGTLQPIKNRPNASFDYTRWCKQRGITHYGFIPLGGYEIVDNHSDLPIRTWGNRVRTSIIELFDSLPFSTEQRSIVIGILLGDKSTMDKEVRLQFQTLGIAHLLAVSGLHTGILFCLMLFMVRRLPNNRRGQILRYPIPIAILWCYAAITGFSPSVVRAVTMCSIYTIGLLLKQQTNAIHALLITAFGMLLYDPDYLFNVGFQLSFSAVLFCLIATRISGETSNKWSPMIRVTGEFTIICIAAQLGTLPLSLLYFGQVQPLFLLSNALSVFILPCLILSALAIVLFSALGMEINFPLFLLQQSLDYLAFIGKTLNSVFNDRLIMVRWDTLDIAIYYISIFALTAGFFEKDRRLLFLALSLITGSAIRSTYLALCS